jgi:hypothetical protein
VLLSPNPHEGKIAKASWEGPYKVVTRINDVVYRIQLNLRSRMLVVHLDKLAPYHGVAWDERTLGGSGCSSWRMNTTEEWKEQLAGRR